MMGERFRISVLVTTTELLELLPKLKHGDEQTSYKTLTNMQVFHKRERENKTKATKKISK